MKTYCSLLIIQESSIKYVFYLILYEWRPNLNRGYKSISSQKNRHYIFIIFHFDFSIAMYIIVYR